MGSGSDPREILCRLCRRDLWAGGGRDDGFRQGAAIPAYLQNKTEAYVAHMEMVAHAAEGLASYAEAFAEHGDDETALAQALVRAEQHYVRAQVKARKAAAIFSRMIDHPSDLAILFLANVFNIRKVDRIADVVRRGDQLPPRAPLLAGRWRIAVGAL